MIVIVILGIVAATVVFAVSGSTTGARVGCKADLKHVESAEEAYYAQVSVVPVDPRTRPRRLLREVPESSDYTFNVDPATGDVTSTPACSSLCSVTLTRHSVRAGEGAVRSVTPQRTGTDRRGAWWRRHRPRRGRRSAPPRGTRVRDCLLVAHQTFGDQLGERRLEGLHAVARPVGSGCGAGWSGRRGRCSSPRSWR